MNFRYSRNLFIAMLSSALVACAGSTEDGSTNISSNTNESAFTQDDLISNVTTPAESTSPAISSALVATQVTDTKVSITWGEYTDLSALDDYQILRGTTDTNLVEIGTNTSNSFTDTTVSTSTLYYYQVVARDLSGNTLSSNIINVRTLNTEQLADCTLTINPGDSFNSAFASLSAGDTLCLNDGIYQQAMDIPSNMNVRAVNDGKAEIDGGNSLGEEWTGGLVQMKGSNSSVRGLRVHHAGTNVHTCYMSGSNNTMQVMSCSHGGQHKHKNPIFMTGSGHLLEDSWAFGKGRYVVQCFTGRDMTIRRNVVRWDTTTLNTESEPNAGFSIYNCSNITVENNISFDYGLSEQYMKFGADFYSPQNCTVWPEGNNNNHYLGNYAVNHALGNANRKGMRFEADCTSQNNVVKDFYVRSSDYGIVIGAKETGLVLENCTFNDINVADIAANGASAGITCNGSAEIGAKYVDRVKVSNNLFPWKNEALIKEDMCRSGERQSDWCSSGKTLSDYVLGQ